MQQFLSPPATQHPHVLWLASWYPNRYDEFSGDFVQRAAKALALYIPVTVLHIYRTNQLPTAFEEEIHRHANLTEHIIYYNPGNKIFGAVDKLNSNRRFMQYGKAWLKNYLLHHERPVIVEVAIAMRMGLLALWMQKKFDIPFHVQEHWTGYYNYLMPPELQKPAWWWCLNNRILKNALHFLPDSRELGKLVQAKFPYLPFTEMPNAVDVQSFYYAGEPGSPFSFLHVSTMTHQKNAEAIIKAFARLNTRFPAARLKLVGPESRAVLEVAAATNLQPGSITFTGALPYEAVAAEMRQAHALILFSRYENLPCVMLEAWCCGVPVVASRVGGIHHHLHAGNGILVDSGNEAQLEIAMEKMILHSGQYNRSQIAAEAAEKYGYETMGAAWLEVYRLIYPHLTKKPLKSGI